VRPNASQLTADWHFFAGYLLREERLTSRGKDLSLTDALIERPELARDGAQAAGHAVDQTQLDGNLECVDHVLSFDGWVKLFMVLTFQVLK
jgi:hypothetical protein